MSIHFTEKNGLNGDIGLYLHVPFCLRKCPYCSFFSVPGDAASKKAFVKAIEQQIEIVLKSEWLKNRKIATIFIGGGTPSVLKSVELTEFLRLFRANFEFSSEIVETSLEVNPATVEYGDLLQLSDAGYNRISIGAQSLDDNELKAIGRPHTAADVIGTIRDARRAGFPNCNVDLMYGLPGQTIATWRQTLLRALDEGPDHLAIYELTIEEGTPFARLHKQGVLDLPAEDTVLEMMAITRQMIGQAGFSRYEISNYAKPGKECFHNINYWCNGEYLGLGPGAVSCLSGRRYTAVKDIAEFCRRVSAEEEWWCEMEELSPEERFRETVIMGLRMVKGVSVNELEHRFNVNPLDYYGATLDKLVQAGLVCIQKGRLFLSNKGMLLANQVMAELV